MVKKCLRCRSNKIGRDGKQSGRQRYRCKDCGYRFQLTRYQPKQQQAELNESYVWGKQTLKQLAETQGKSIPWVKEQLDKHNQLTKVDRGPASIRSHTWAAVNPDIPPKEVVLVIDAFYYHRGDGTMLFRASNCSANVL